MQIRPFSIGKAQKVTKSKKLIFLNNVTNFTMEPLEIEK